MPRHSKGPYLIRRPARKKNGLEIAKPVWIIRDGKKHIATGCLGSSTEQGEPVEALKALQKYIAGKYSPERSQRDVDDIDIADVLTIYRNDTKERQSSPRQFDSRIRRLNRFFGGRKLGQINDNLVAEYVKIRKAVGGARRDLEDLRAAEKHHAKQGFHRAVIHITMPPKGPGRERWLTRKEAARLLWVCWRYREKQTLHRGAQKGQLVETAKAPLRHLSRFLLIGLYTGTRAASILSASPIKGDGHSFVDLNGCIFYRLAQGKRETNKRQTPVPIPKRLAAHMRRWVKNPEFKTHFVEFEGKPVKSVKTAFKSAVKKASLSLADGNVSPHTLRHTAATWLMKNGVPLWEAAKFLGMSEPILRETYAHHHPDFLRGAAEAMTAKGRTGNVTVVKSVVEVNHLQRK